MTTHWSSDNHDSTKTACNELVGYLLCETQDEVTRKVSDVDCKACREFLEGEKVNFDGCPHGAGDRICDGSCTCIPCHGQAACL